VRRWVVVALSFIPIAANVSGGMSAQEVPAPAAAERNTAVIRPSVDPPEGFVIGPEDVLSIVFWRDKEMSTRVTVRPDGRISLPLLDDVQAAGLTAEQLRGRLIEESKRFFANPAVTVAVAAQRVPETFVRSTVTTRSASSGIPP
jgi:protein involved in polysaccharide export with SLBB domain